MALTLEVEEQLAIIASNRLYVEQESVIECRSSSRPGTSESTASIRGKKPNHNTPCRL